MLPPDPSKNLRPHRMDPSVRLSQRLVVRSQHSHFHPLGGTLTPLSSWRRSSACLDGRISSPSHWAVVQRAGKKTEVDIATSDVVGLSPTRTLARPAGILGQPA